MGVAKPARMVRHEETKKTVRALMDPVVEEMVSLTDACLCLFITTNS